MGNMFLARLEVYGGQNMVECEMCGEDCKDWEAWIFARQEDPYCYDCTIGKKWKMTEDDWEAKFHELQEV